MTPLNQRHIGGSPLVGRDGTVVDVSEPRGQRWIAAHHEAGHAVAAVMRGGSTLTSVTLSETEHGHGSTWARQHQWDTGFLTYGGPWAEARCKWGDRPLDGEDEDGATFPDAVTGVFLEQPSDAAALIVWTQSQTDIGITREMLRQSDEVWQMELEQVWGGGSGGRAPAARRADRQPRRRAGLRCSLPEALTEAAATLNRSTTITPRFVRTEPVEPLR